MPRGYHKAQQGAQVSLLEQAMHDLQERIDAMRARERGVEKLRHFLDAHPHLQKSDVMAVVREMPKIRNPGELLAKGMARDAKPNATRGKPKKGTTLKPAKGKAGKAIRAARLKAELSTTRLGQMIGGGSGYISHMEQGKIRPSQSKAERLAKALNIPLATILPNGHDATA